LNNQTLDQFSIFKPSIRPKCFSLLVQGAGTYFDWIVEVAPEIPAYNFIGFQAVNDHVGIQ
jgi:hypothetical protein